MLILNINDFMSGYISVPNLSNKAYSAQLEGIIAEFEPIYIRRLFGIDFEQWVYRNNCDDIKKAIKSILKYFIFYEWLQATTTAITSSGSKVEGSEVGGDSDSIFNQVQVWNLGVEEYEDSYCKIAGLLPTNVRIKRACLCKTNRFGL